MKTNLKSLRKATGMTANDFAESIGVNRYTYRGWEQGVRNYDIEQAVAIANHLGVSLDELLRPQGKKTTVRSNNLKELIKEQSNSIMQFADEVNIPYTTLANSLGSDEKLNEMPIDNFKKVASALRLTVDELLSVIESDDEIDVYDNVWSGITWIIDNKCNGDKSIFSEKISSCCQKIDGWLEGITLPTADCLVQIALKFDISLDWLLLGDLNRAPSGFDKGKNENKS